LESGLKNYVASFLIGREERHQNMAVFPITTPPDGGPDYETLKEALEKGTFVVTEVSEGGNVPNLKVTNKGVVPVLLIDGEELAGAKQNRVLNTTILVKGGTEVVIPVSCTEQGRWSYISREFHDAGHVMVPNMRAMNKRAVAASLENAREFRADQGEVWKCLYRMAVVTGTESRTGAMKDVFESKKDDLDAYLESFACKAGQKGILVMIGGKVVGFDFVSREAAFSLLYPKLIKSYAMEAWIEGRQEKKKQNKEPAQAEAVAGEEDPKAREFLAAVAESSGKAYDSVGMGQDFRFDGKGIVGSALVVDEKLVHMAFFGATDSQKIENMAGPSRRRSFRA
jgi:hypothetical protein